MTLVAMVLEWTRLVFEPSGLWGLFVLAFIESIFFPIPPDMLLLVLCLARPEFALIYAGIATIASTLGGVVGYIFGFGCNRLVLVRLFSRKRIARVHRIFTRYEVATIFFAGFTPVPYKLFALASGIFYLDFRKFLFATFASRGARFFLEAVLIMVYGEAMVAFLEESFNMYTLIGAGALVGAYFLYRYVRKPVRRKR